MKRRLATAIAALTLAALLAGCASESEPATPEVDTPAPVESAITVISREEGSGTRGAFVELLGIEVKNEEGVKEDMTLLEADITDSTAVMLTSVAGNERAIGYVSMGSLNDTVKALAIDGVAPGTDTVKSGEYAVARPFILATKGELGKLPADFLAFILSDEGQKVVEENGYVPIDSTGAYTAGNLEGKIVVAGSSSVTPVMEKLKEAYIALNPNAKIEVQQSDSSTGMSSASDGTCDIGMASRELKDSEIEAGLAPTIMAMDGVAVIVNPANAIEGLTAEQVRQVYVGELTDWAQLAQ